MTTTLPDLERHILEGLDFQPECYRCQKTRATHRVLFVCGCDGLTCLPCVVEMERHFKDAIAWARGHGVPHFFRCAGCGKPASLWPIRDVTPL